MIREYWSMQESLYVDAWKNGGEVEGQPVTDERLLKFWLDRRDSFDRSDPMWDYYNNIHDQYNFNIEESKVGLAYAQHKMSAREVARWYKQQSNNYPVDSEMYRTIMGQAARFLDAARAQAKASAAKRRSKAYADAMTKVYTDEIYPSMYILDGLTYLLRSEAGMAGSQTITPTEGAEGVVRPGESRIGPGVGLIDMSVSNGGTLLWPEILRELNTPGTDANVYWTTVIMPLANKAGIVIDMPFDQTDLDRLNTVVNNGYDHAIAVDKKFPDVASKDHINQMLQGKSDWNDQYQFLSVIDGANAYSTNRNNLNTILTDATMTPYQKVDAFYDYMNKNDKVAAQYSPIDPIFGSAWQGEKRSILGNTAGEPTTLWENALNSPWNTPATGQVPDSIYLANQLAQAQGQVDALSRGNAVLVRQPDGSTVVKSIGEVFSDSGGNYAILPHSDKSRTINPKQNVILEGGEKIPAHPLGGEYDTSVTNVTYGEAVQVIPIVVVAPALQADTATGRFPDTNLPGIPGASDNQVGFAAIYPDGEGNYNVLNYGIRTPTGEIRWTEDDPFVTGSYVSIRREAGKNGMQLTITANTDRNNLGQDNSGLRGYDKDGNETTNPADVATWTFDYHSVTDWSHFGTTDPTTGLFTPSYTSNYSDPMLSHLLASESGRKYVARTDPFVLAGVAQSSPFTNWQDDRSVSQFFGDILKAKLAVRQSQMPNDPYADTTGTLAFWDQLATEGDPNNPWAKVIAASYANFKIDVVREWKNNAAWGTPAGVSNPRVPGEVGPDALRAWQDNYWKISKGVDVTTPNSMVAWGGGGAPKVTYGGFNPSQVQPPPTQAPQSPQINVGQQINVPGLPPLPTPGSPGINPRGNRPGQGPSVPPPPLFTTHPEAYGNIIAPYSGTPLPMATPPPLPDYLLGKGCFVAGTLVNTPDGYVPIEQLSAGDKVMAFDEATGLPVVSEVERVLTHLDHEEPRVKVEVGPVVIEATVGHRFYDPQTGNYREIGEFELGDMLFRDGQPDDIDNMTWIGGDPLDVYNIEVAEHHNYFVHGVLVHNAKTNQGY